MLKKYGALFLCMSSFLCIGMNELAVEGIVQEGGECTVTRYKDKRFGNLLVYNLIKTGALSVVTSGTIGGNLVVNGGETVGGDLVVAGSVTANNYLTPAGPLSFYGIRNYAVLSNDAAVGSGQNILWAATPATNFSAGITNVAGSIILPVGIFLVQYSVRFTVTPFAGSSTGTAQLQQTVAGVPTNITQPAIINNAEIDGITDGFPSSERLVTGYAFIMVTSAANNALNMVITVGTNITLPLATAPDANSQMVILQLN